MNKITTVFFLLLISSAINAQNNYFAFQDEDDAEVWKLLNLKSKSVSTLKIDANGINWIGDFNNGIALAQSEKSKLWGFLDVQGNWVLQPNYPQLFPFSAGLALAQDAQTKKWGYLNLAGNWAIPAQYVKAQSFNNKNKTALVHIPCQKDCLSDLEDFRGLILGKITTQIIDTKGKIVHTDSGQEEEPYKRFWFSQNEDDYLVKTKGRSLGEYKVITNLKDEVINSDYMGISEKEQLIFSDGLLYMGSEGATGNKFFIDKTGKTILDISDKYTYSSNFKNGFAWAGKLYDDDRESTTHLIDKKGNSILSFSEEEYSDESFYNPKTNAFVAVDSKSKNFVFLDKNKQPVFKNKAFEYAKNFDENGFAFIQSADEDACFINIKGDCVFKLKDFTFQPDEQHIEYFPTDNIVRIETLSISDEDDVPVMPTPNDTSVFLKDGTKYSKIFDK